MKIKIQITVESDDGQLNVAQDVAHLDRGILRPETLGLTLAEARSILAGIEQTVVEQQAAEFMALQRTCSHCVHERSCKGRMVKKQQMRWTDRGAHLLLQMRTRVLNEDWRST